MIDWDEWYRRLYVYCRTSFGLGHEEAQDCIQDIAEKVIKSRDTIEPKRNITPWLYTVARHHMIDRIRKLDRSPPYQPMDSDFPAAGYDGPEGLVTAAALKKRIGEALEGLDAVSREIAYLSFFEELDSRAVGKIVGMPAGTVRFRLHRIRRNLSEILKREGLM